MRDTALLQHSGNDAGRRWKQAILRRRRWTGGPLAGAEFGAVSLVWDVGVGLGAGRRDRQRCGDGCEGQFHIRCNPRRRRQVIRSGDDALAAPSPARPYRPSRVRRVRTHGGGPLPAGTGARHAACRRRLGAWLASLADRPASCWAGDPCAGTGNRPAVPAGGDVAGLSGVACAGLRIRNGWLRQWIRALKKPRRADLAARPCLSCLQ